MAHPGKGFDDEELSLMLGLDANGMKPLHIAAQIMAYRQVFWLEGKARKEALISREHVRNALSNCLDQSETDKDSVANGSTIHMAGQEPAKNPENATEHSHLQKTAENVDFSELRAFGVVD